MGKGMGAGTVDGKGCADTDAGDHVAYLTDNFPAEQPANIVFHDGVNDAVNGHDHTENDKDIEAREDTHQGIDGSLGGESAHENGTCGGRFAVGIREPGMKRRHGGVEHETGHDKPGVKLGVLFIKVNEGEVAGGLIAKDKPHEQQHAAKGMDQQIAVTCSKGTFLLVEPDEKGRGKGHHFPEQKKTR